MTVLDEAGAEAGAEEAVPSAEIGPVRLATLWAFVGAGGTAGATVVITEAFATDVQGGAMALGLVLIAAAALLGLVLGVHQLLPAGRTMATPSRDREPGELGEEAVMAFWVFGAAGVIAGATSVFLSASAVGSSVLVLSGLVCLVTAASRRLPRGW